MPRADPCGSRGHAGHVSLLTDLSRPPVRHHLRIASFIERHWTVGATATIVAVGTMGVAVSLARDRPGSIIGVVGLGITLIVGLWSIEFTRRDLRQRTRPYLAVTGVQVVPNQSGGVVLRPRLQVAGDYPAVVTKQMVVRTAGGKSETFDSGVTQSNIIYPGEDVLSGSFPCQAGSSITLTFDYEDLSHRRQFQFLIEYSLDAAGQPGIVRKDAT